MPPCIDRRLFLTALASLVWTNSPGQASKLTARRIVALDAPSTEMLVTLGIEPLGVAGLDGYRQAEGDIPALRNAVDVGFFYEPNLELLQFLKPDLFMASFGVGAPIALLERVAPVLFLPIYGQSGSSHQAAVEALNRIASLMGRQADGRAFLSAYEEKLIKVEAKVRVRRTRPLYLASPLLDGRHIILYGKDSLFDNVLQRVGLENAFAGQTSPWGVATVGIDALTTEPESVLVYIESPVTQAALKALNASMIWKLLPFVQDERVVPIPYLEMYGALPTASRFANILDGMLDQGIFNAG